MPNTASSPASSYSATTTHTKPLLKQQYDNNDNNNDNEEKPLTPLEKWSFFCLWISFALIGHMCKGFHVGLSDYLKQSDNQPPAYSILVLGNTFVLLLYSPRMIYKLFRYIFSNSSDLINEEDGIQERREALSFHYLWQDRIKPILTHWSSYAFAFAAMLRAFTKGKSVDYTSAMFVQLMLIFSPFFIEFIQSFIMKKSKLQWQTITAVVIAAIGSFCIVLGGTTRSEQGFHWLPNFHQFGEEIDKNDAIGIVLALFAALFLSIRTVLLNYISDSEHLKISCENVFVGLRVIYSLSFLIPFLVLGSSDFNHFKQFTWIQWCIFFVTSIFNYGIGSYFNIYATVKLGSSMFGVLLPTRLLATTIIAVALLGDKVNNLFHILGFMLILIGTSGYMIWRKRNDESPSFSDQKPILRRSKNRTMEPFSNLKLFQ
jgi:drug/metabolite transporter (DMT)-like permease